jgi:hypothetical protein
MFKVTVTECLHDLNKAVVRVEIVSFYYIPLLGLIEPKKNLWLINCPNLNARG